MRRSIPFVVCVFLLVSMIMPTQVPAAEPVTIEWWQIWPNEDYIREPFQAMADQFMAENPGVEIVITEFENEAFKQKIATAMQSGEPPDIFQSWGGGVLGVYVDAGLVQDLTPALAEEGWGDTISSGAKAIFEVDGKNYSIPWRAGMAGIYYNKELFAQAGIDSPPETWAELLEDVKKLKDAGITPIAIGEGDKWPGMFWYAYLLARMASPEEILGAANRTGSFDSPGYVAAGEKLEELIALEPFQTGFLGATYDEAEALMANAGAAMHLMGHWGYGYSSGSLAEDPDAYNASIGWFPFPSVEGGNGEPTAIFGGGDSFAVGKDAPPEAIEFIRFVLSPESHQTLVESTAVPIPIVEGVVAEYPHPLFEDMAAQIGQAKFVLNYLDHQFPPPLNSAVNDEVQKLFAGQATGEEVGKALEELAKENLDQ
jgi:raffinose/stachyose/melibiose transport system substrate-binding protein